MLEESEAEQQQCSLAQGKCTMRLNAAAVFARNASQLGRER